MTIRGLLLSASRRVRRFEGATLDMSGTVVSRSAVTALAARFARPRRSSPCRGSTRAKSSASSDFQKISGVAMSETLSRLSEVSVEPFKGSRYVVPQTIRYKLGDSTRTWDMIKSMGSVAIVLYHRDREAAILVRQFRPPVWAASDDREAPLEKGFTYELCAGLLDKTDLPAAVVAREEILEECGFDVPLDSIDLVTTYVHACAHLGTEEKIFYCEVRHSRRLQMPSPFVSLTLLPLSSPPQVDDSMRATEGGGLSEDGEAIEVFSIPLADCEAFIFDSRYPKSAAAIIGLQYLLQRKKREGVVLP